LSVLGALSEPWVAIDGYHFDEAYVARAQGAGCRVLHLDDMAHLSRYTADIVVNQNAHAGTLRYRTGPRTKLLAGPRYAILRPEFSQVRPPWRTRRRAKHLLITFGGADPHQLTEKAIRAVSLLGRRPALTVTVVVGGANPRWRRIARLAKATDDRIRLVRAATNMAEIMAAADLAVSSAGTTVWELAAMGVPALLIESGPSEHLVLTGLKRIGLYDELGCAPEIQAGSIAGVISARLEDPHWRHRAHLLARKTVDGHGVGRILSAMFEAGH
jgi:UDP-2,4-diacetamido-2,4,6-trideoxy-beta-L-altropyranose hydrolase